MLTGGEVPGDPGSSGLPSNGNPGSNLTANQNSERLCSGDETLAGKYTQENKLQFVVNAVYALAHSLHNLVVEHCGDKVKVTPAYVSCVKVVSARGDLVYKQLLNTSFDGEKLTHNTSVDSLDGVFKIVTFIYLLLLTLDGVIFQMVSTAECSLCQTVMVSECTAYITTDQSERRVTITAAVKNQSATTNTATWAAGLSSVALK